MTQPNRRNIIYILISGSLLVGLFTGEQMLFSVAYLLRNRSGAVGLVSIASEFFVIVRVRGKHVQVLLSDELAATDWPIARDVPDFLGSELPDDDEDAGPIGDLDILADVGMPDFELEALCDADEDSDALVERIAKKVKFGPQYRKTVQAAFGL